MFQLFLCDVGFRPLYIFSSCFLNMILIISSPLKEEVRNGIHYSTCGLTDRVEWAAACFVDPKVLLK